MQENYSVGVYCRLSHDDETAGESVSIENQKIMLGRYIQEQDWNLVCVRCDDGVSGTTFDRPGFNELLNDVSTGKVNLVLCKDLSRLGRDYIEMGRYVDIVFPSRGCRFIALNDGVDTLHKNNEMVAILKNVMNDLYARDTSNKIKAVKQSTFRSGKYVGCYAPIGYRKSNAPENMSIFFDTQPTIIDRNVFERVQELRANKRCPAKQAERQGMFPGLLYCADCGSKLHFATGKNMTPEQDCYRCARYKSNTGDCTMHFIREETLKRFVLRRIFDVTAMFFEDIMSFQEAVQIQRFEETEKEAKKRKREIVQTEKRIAELDRIFKRIYEDDVSGAISHERFLKLSAEYEAEQKELTEKVKADREMVSTYEQDKADFDSFAAVIRKYVGITELTPTIVNKFVKKIIVHAPDKSSGHRRQKIQIIWNFVGELKQEEDKQTIKRQRKSRTA